MVRYASVLLSVLVIAPAFAGDLDPPPGPVAPTMKSLDELEPRIALSDENTPGAGTTGFIITAPGSYYLTENLTGPVMRRGIEVLADNVTIDLNGFTIAAAPGGTEAQRRGIDAFNFDHVTIRNGKILGFGEEGIFVRDHARIENVSVEFCVGVGIRTRDDCVVTDCIAINNGGSGISCDDNSVIRSCAVSFNGGFGIRGTRNTTVAGCSSLNNASHGYFLTGNNTVSDCTSIANSTNGFQLGDGTAATNCTARENISIGFSLNEACTVENCTSSDNGNDGFITLSSSGTTLRGCSAFENGDDGFELRDDVLIESCVATGNADAGIRLRDRCVVRDCLVTNNTTAGVLVVNDCQVIGNTGAGNGVGLTTVGGVTVNGLDNRIEGNAMSDGGIGFDINNNGNLIVRNSSSGNTTDYSILGINSVGTIQFSPVGAGPWDNFDF